MAVGLSVCKNPFFSKKLVQAPGDIGNHVPNQDFGQAAIREVVGARSDALLDWADGPLDLADVAVCSNHVEVDGEKGGLDASKLVVGMDVADVEIMKLIEFHNGSRKLQHHVVGSVGHWSGGAIAN